MLLSSLPDMVHTQGHARPVFQYILYTIFPKKSIKIIKHTKTIKYQPIFIQRQVSIRIFNIKKFFSDVRNYFTARFTALKIKRSKITPESSKPPQSVNLPPKPQISLYGQILSVYAYHNYLIHHLHILLIYISTLHKVLFLCLAYLQYNTKTHKNQKL